MVPREARSSCGFVARGGSIRKKGHFIVKKSKRNRIELALQLQILSIMNIMNIKALKAKNLSFTYENL